MMHKWITCLLVTALVAAWSAAAAAQNVPEEARRHMARGIAAIEMQSQPGTMSSPALEFEKAAKLAPDWPEVYYSLGGVQAKNGDPASAVKSYQRYLELAPRSPDAERSGRRFTSSNTCTIGRNRLQRSRCVKASNGQTFKLLLDGSRLQLTRDEQQATISSRFSRWAPTRANDGCAAAGFFRNPDRGNDHGDVCPGGRRSSGHCDLPERKGTFEGTVDSSAGRMRLVYKRVALEYEMEFKSILSTELICRQTNRKETPGYALELKRIP